MTIYTFVRIEGLVLCGICALVMVWLVADDLYTHNRWFRRTWRRTGLPFPFTAFSPHFKPPRR